MRWAVALGLVDGVHVSVIAPPWSLGRSAAWRLVGAAGAVNVTIAVCVSRTPSVTSVAVIVLVPGVAERTLPVV
jgi:hypothetical protein